MSTQRSLLNNTIMPIIFCIAGHIRAIVEHARPFIYNILLFSTVYKSFCYYNIYIIYIILCLKTFLYSSKLRAKYFLRRYITQTYIITVYTLYIYIYIYAKCCMRFSRRASGDGVTPKKPHETHNLCSR